MTKQRPTKTRSKTQRLSSRPALAVSTLRFTAVDLSPGHEHLVCPDCDTWTPVTGIRSTPRLVPHHTEPAGSPEPRRCIGTNRVIILDITADRWQRRFAEGGAETDVRRATPVLPKPVVPVAPPVGEMRPASLAAATVRAAHTTHLAHCPACLEGEPCTTAEALDVTLTHVTREEARRPAASRPEPRRTHPRHRAAQWARVSRAVSRTDTRREQLPEGDAPTEWNVPTEPLDMAYQVLAHLGPDCERLCDESLWQRHRRGGASMQLAPGLRLVWHADPEIFAVAQSSTRIETTITPGTVGQVLAILAHDQA